MAPVAEDREAVQPWKTVLCVDPAVPKGESAVAAAAYSFGNAKYDALELALYFPQPGAELQVRCWPWAAQLSMGVESCSPRRLGCSYLWANGLSERT